MSVCGTSRHCGRRGAGDPPSEQELTTVEEDITPDEERESLRNTTAIKPFNSPLRFCRLVAPAKCDLIMQSADSSIAP
jgi:hypothetical protein